MLSVRIFRSWAESTRDTYNYGQYMNQFPPNTIKVIREFERIQKKICRHKMSIMFNEICINEEMLPKYTYFKSHLIYMYKKYLTLNNLQWLIYHQTEPNLIDKSPISSVLSSIFNEQIKQHKLITDG